MIHQYKLSGYNIVLDVYSGSVHAVDDVAYDAIALIDQGSSREQAAAALAKKYADRADVTAADISDVLDDIDELTAAGQLFAPDAYADHAFDFKNRSNVVKALCLHVAHTCNLNCSYCFAAQGKFHGEAGLMSFETGKRALDFLIENSGTRRNLEVDFFGGEPLMNFEVCKQLVAYARSIEKKYNKNFRFTMTTNGIGITDEVIDWCNKECHNVVLSLDGRKEVNDRFRVDLAGNGSYDRIVPKFQKLVKARGGQGYYMRGTFTHHNVDFTKDLFHMADDLGFTELSMEPVVAPPDSPEALTEEDLQNLKIAKQCGVTGVMLPFVRGAADIRSLRQALAEASAPQLKILAKIENLAGVQALPEFLPLVDEVVIARGDLGNAMPLWELPRCQKQLSAACRAAGVPFMVVTQMLDSMHTRAVPTRAEVSDIYNAVLDGASSLMLTGETAVGQYPVQAMEYLVRTARTAM